MDQMPEEQSAKVEQLRTSLGHLSGRAKLYCSDICLERYLRARSWNVKKAKTLVEDTLRWRASFKPEDIKWEDVSFEAETGKVFIESFVDKHGRPVIQLTPAKENSDSVHGQIQTLVYTMESAAFYLPLDQHQFVIIVDFKGWSILKATPLSTVREISNILQNHYPERLAVGIMLNPPKVFEYFWKLWKPFVDPVTYQKTRFVYTKSKDRSMEDVFEKQVWTLVSENQYNHVDYGQKMKENDARKASYWKSADTDLEHVNGAA